LSRYERAERKKESVNGTIPCEDTDPNVQECGKQLSSVALDGKVSEPQN
jgi:hypothetical protein